MLAKERHIEQLGWRSKVFVSSAPPLSLSSVSGRVISDEDYALFMRLKAGANSKKEGQKTIRRQAQSHSAQAVQSATDPIRRREQHK